MGACKKIIQQAHQTLDAGVKVYQKIKPIADEAVQAFGNERVRDFSRKAQSTVDTGIQRGQKFTRAFSDNIDKVDKLGNDFMMAFQ